ncbi:MULTISPECIES: hypothetical protein [unclassified Oceanobacter]|uniref:tetratricopeptide repeat protein n=3 Tax=Gammaproteobacteria TaxID=1236 RepID=UPI00273301FA|nr:MULTISPECIES: hypothetical protein [unclassified Oceanobacter]MDP2546858.1 hypothetical protein [Oceanobacter sp. 4_MG-2023]MDP2607685.1 hypothetical protein [Oceanobacter sp. 1_MG-2023]MDP2611131.1 hypothetical protein [Oceanobacter sp. 2_MG-2023]
MQKSGLLALAVAATAWVSSTACAQPTAPDNGLISTLSASVPAPKTPLEILNHELGKRVYFFHYLTSTPLDAITDDDAEPTLSDMDIMYTLPAGLSELGMDSYANVLLNDPALGLSPGMGNTWFMLARNASDRNDWLQAGRLIGRAMANDALLNPTDTSEAAFIAATSHANRDQITQAEQAFDLIDEESEWYRFAGYNLMLAKMRLGISSKDLQQWVGEFLVDEAEDQQQSALNDRFRLTAGKYELRNKHYDEAISYLRLVSKDGPYTSDALLQYGWALSKRWQYDQALQPWRVLQEHFPLLNIHTLESLMATSYVAELMNGGVPSLPVYEYTEKRMTEALEQLDQLNNIDTLSQWVSHWEERQSSASDNILSPDLQGVASSSTSRHLEGLLSTSAFLQEQQRLIDIRSMLGWVQQQQQHLSIARADKLANQAIYLEVVESDHLAQVADNTKQLQQQIIQINHQIQAHRNQPLGFAIQPERNRLDQLEAITNESKDGTSMEQDVQTQASILQGITLWQLTKAQPQRAWALQKQQLVLEQQYQDLNTQLTNINELLAQAGAFHARSEEHLATIDAVSNKLGALEQTLTALHTKQQQQVVTVAQSHIGMLKDRLKDYLATTRLSIARLYDGELRRNTNSGGLGEYD